ncbi:uncharacterized protein PAN0_001c0829 [Moesziomyces antarcticus]|uniref:Uncharacterized protein n=1 Tax=Pseudozyma antarctica TaxID=84753 RepID=A0A5C3FG85_PSEA2|nr:uncharacterized protein PAN0_001c0829 [Moesziomyces antarcticus]GAK62628.1 conserved hypothetical protein [Moesziomyces antarcticus]SPO43190.1 uncharacterized protein PSANT_00874 [Moesziomyces antarcticus]
MASSAMKSLLSTLLVASFLAPLGVLGSVQHSSIPMDKRAAVSDGSECWTDFAKNSQDCPVLQVAFFKDAQCSQALNLVRTTPQALIKGNKQMLFEGAVAHSLKEPVGSVRIIGAVPGIGLGFARQEESDSVVQNMAWMSSSETMKAYQSKSCVSFANLDAKRVGVWTVKADDSFNPPGVAWDEDNIPITESAHACAEERHAHRRGTQTVCLESASWGKGGVLQLYNSDDCTGRATKQVFSAAQCTPLKTTGFKSFKTFRPQGDKCDVIFSPEYYDIGQDGYHRCAQLDITAVKPKSGACQKFDNGNMFVGVYSNDPQFPQPAPGPGDKVLLQSHGVRLLSPGPGKPAGKQRGGAGFYGP